MKTEKRTIKNKPENVFSYYDEENSRNENSASRENAEAELDVFTGSSAAAWNTTDGWSKDFQFTNWETYFNLECTQFSLLFENAS